jgi:hypothetical protein
MTARRFSLLLLGLGLLASQAGHMLAYQVVFGTAAQQMQSSGAHAYFPTTAKAGLGILGIIAVAALLVIGSARMVGGRALGRVATRPSFLRSIAALFTIQLAVFAVQETVESMVAGARPSSVTVLLLWGTLGQLPVAAVAALAVVWIATRFSQAVITLRRGLATRVASLAPAPLVSLTRTPVSLTVLAEPYMAAYRRRGPP